MSDNDTSLNQSGEQIGQTLGLLDAIDSGEKLTQRSLAKRLGVALGLANALLKRAARKGLIKIHDIPARRYAYYMTPQGFQEKSNLVREYLSTSLNFFRRTRLEYEEGFTQCQSRGWTRIALYGTGELAEIATIAAHSAGVQLVAVIDREINQDAFCGIPVVRNLAEAGEIDAVLITDSTSPQQTFELLAGELSAELIITPPLLHVSRNGYGNPNDKSGDM